MPPAGEAAESLFSPALKVSTLGEAAIHEEETRALSEGPPTRTEINVIHRPPREQSCLSRETPEERGRGVLFSGRNHQFFAQVQDSLGKADATIRSNKLLQLRR